MTLHQSAEKLA